MLTHETNTGFETQETNPEDTEGVRLSRLAAETLSGIFNMDRNQFEAIEDIEQLRQFVYEPIEDTGYSLYDALDDCIKGEMVPHELELPYGRIFKLERDGDAFRIARTQAAHVTAWTNGPIVVSVPHRRYGGAFTAQNGRMVVVSGNLRPSDPELVAAYQKELVKELREIDIALRIKEFDSPEADITEVHALVSDELYQVSRNIELSEREAVDDPSLVATLYDRAGYLMGAEYFDWLLQNGSITIPSTGGHIHISHEQLNEYQSDYHFELCDDELLRRTGQHYLQTWLKIGRNHCDYLEYSETDSSTRTARKTIYDYHDPRYETDRYKIKMELQRVFNIVADYVSLGDPYS